MSGAKPRDAGNLPSELSSFVGRRRELRKVRELLADSRLVTLAGVGGTGKTRLALRAAAELRRAFPDGVWLVDLIHVHGTGLFSQGVQDPDVLAFLVTITLKLREPSCGTTLGWLVEQLADRHMLLILDNCEHLLPASAILANALMRGCPDLRLLATSREPLMIAGEVLVAVPPLSIPSVSRRTGLVELGRSESVALFLDRAEAVRPGFDLTEIHQVAVADVCRRLDGLPLAIELAAARIRELAPQQILDRLTDRFALLARGGPTGPERQRTLRACVDWSFDLCAKPERVLWARLSVFASGFELDTIVGVCADENLPRADLPELVAGLVDKSILVHDDVQDGPEGVARYRMLETIREYGQEKLRVAGEEGVLRRRHRDWHQQLAERASVEWVSDRQPYWLSRLTRDHPNLEAALEFCLTEPGEASAALRLAVSVPELYWYARGLRGEGRHWLRRALEQATDATAMHARALLIGSLLAFGQGDAAAGMRLLDEGEGEARRLNAIAELAYAAFLRGVGAMFVNDLSVAMTTLNRARTLLSGALDRERDLNLYLTVLFALGTSAGLADEHEQASACVSEMLAIVEPRGEALHRALALWAAGLIAWRREDLLEAAAQEMECLRLKRAGPSDDWYSTILCLEVLAWISADQQRHRRAAALLGAAEALQAEVGTAIASYPYLAIHHRACERKASDALGDAAFHQALREGQILTYEAAIAYALEEPTRLAPASPENAPARLTRRERQVAELITQGLSNKDIATKLVVSQRTAESHVEHIFTKLGFAKRAQVAAWMATQCSDSDTADEARDN